MRQCGTIILMADSKIYCLFDADTGDLFEETPGVIYTQFDAKKVVSTILALVRTNKTFNVREIDLKTGIMRTWGRDTFCKEHVQRRPVAKKKK